MYRNRFVTIFFAAATIAAMQPAAAGQAPGAAADPDVPISHRDRVYAAEQFSNTVSVTDPADNKLLGVIRLGDPTPGNMSPLYRGQLLVHGMGFSPDHRTLAVVSIGSNSVAFIDTATNKVKHITYVGRSPHEAFFTPDGSEVWVTIRGEDYVAVLDGKTYAEKTRITVPAGPGHADLLARRPIRLCLLVVQSGDRRDLGRRPQDRRPRQAGEPVLPEHRRDAGRHAGLADAQGRRQGHGVQRPPAFRRASRCSTPARSPITSTSRTTRAAPSPTSRSAASTRSRCSAPTVSSRSRPSRSASCRTACGPRATARGCMSAWRTATASPPSTR